MTSFCGCNDDGYDFDPADHDSYFLCGRSVPEPAAKCCECGALLPTDRKRDAAIHYEVYDPAEAEPPGPTRGMPDDEWDAAQEALYAFREAHGWDDENGRYERKVGSDWRCDRCEQEAEILAQFDVCVAYPGELPGLHEEFAWQHRKRRIRWRPDMSGVLQPAPWRVRDYAGHYWRRVYWRIRREWQWEFSFRLKRVILWPAKRRLAAMRRVMARGA